MENKIGSIISSKRKALGLTQQNISERLNISYQAVSKWENGTSYPDLELLPRLAAILGTTVDGLLGYPVNALTVYEERYKSEDYYWGLPTIDFAKKALQIAATADEQALQDVAKGGRHKILLQETTPQNNGGTRGRQNPNELRKTAARFGEDWAAGDVVVLDNVMNPTLVSQTSQQLGVHLVLPLAYSRLNGSQHELLSSMLRHLVR